MNHPLEFGAFLTPTAAQPGAVVELSTLVERLGYDLVTFQDHPYQASFLDTWTLMSYVAAKTERIRIAPNVLNLPLRPPAVVARAAASLDLLSNGRFDLGLGAGAFWDAIASMGGARLTPGQGITALEEAITIIRGIWQTDAPGGVTVDGRYHRVAGAQRGPAPEHPIPIIVGALKPKMLALTGRLADGWLPSQPYLRDPTLTEANKIIDDAAVGAGRDPSEVRRLLNVMPVPGRDPADWAEELSGLVLTEQVSLFILASDDPRTLQGFIENVAPAVRELVTAERGGTSPASPAARSTATLAHRRPGISYDDIPANLAAIEPGDAGYRDVRSTYLRGGSPAVVLQPTSVAEVAEALEFARKHPDAVLALRSRGHGISGRSTNDGGIVIDLRHLDSIEVIDEERRLVRIGPGASWSDVATALAPYGWAVSSGDYGGVGVGGLATAGGIGWLARQNGLTIDHIEAVELMLADGEVVRVDADHDPELFWAMRGAGSALGIATAFEIIADPVGLVAFAQLTFDATDVAGFFERFGRAVEAAPRSLTANIMMGSSRRGSPSQALVMALVDSDDEGEILSALQPLADIAPLIGQDVRLQRYTDAMMASTDPHRGQGQPAGRSILIDHFTAEVGQNIAALLESGTAGVLSVRSVGGAVSDVAADATAYAGRSANFAVVALGSNNAALDSAWAPLERHAVGAYLSFETQLDARRLRLTFPPATLERLQAVKSRVDPHNVFRDNINLGQLDGVTKTG
ncbi:LLM class flavin-dependent oxidoreductase [Cryobacterium melibiosiphilum]|uniref:LLM class flavin-dependent oxidoreductase n=1 Tax=Cryobacterium melibiosiphilum TaxID=995039 RepID=A0A3A5MHR8_9MICO|nr:LLM class flavin-dependent oxidoreductase [Cryobacterium melibiosiphilum]RJT85186.1 LLM class flavin-dependent oxidoreductase [Cryobacterium melibiosiphilum]